jgi:hypothetical protein
MDSRIFKEQLQGSKLIGLRHPLYHWKALGTQMFEMGSYDPFGHLKHKLWSKEGPKIKLTIWFMTTKSRESPRFPYVQVACDVPLESSWQGIQLCFRPQINQRFVDKVMGPQSWDSHPKLGPPSKITGVPTLGISRLPFGNPRIKCHLDVGPMANHRIYYKGESGGFPQVGAAMSLVNLNFPWLVLAPKVFQLCTNQLVVWFVQVRVTNWNACHST